MAIDHSRSGPLRTSGGQGFSLQSPPSGPGGRVNDGRSAVVKYLTGYVIEKSLSVDNVFVIAVRSR